MVQRLHEYRRIHGHGIVSKQDDAQLFVWANSIRKNYQAPQQQKLENKDTTSTSPLPTTATTNNNKSSKKALPADKLDQLEECGFVWDVQEALWNKRFHQWQDFCARHGGPGATIPVSSSSSSSSSNSEYAEVAVWVRNQKREYRHLQNQQQQRATSTFATHPHRLQQLQQANFSFGTPRDTAWQTQYQALVQYVAQHGHAHVPEHGGGGSTPLATVPGPANATIGSSNNNSPSDWFSLGQWCMNQRTAYRRHVQGLSSSLTPDKIQLLQDLNFTWNLRETKWYRRLHQAKLYYEQHGHVHISPHDATHKELRLWLSVQRYYYNVRQRALKQHTRQQQQHQESPKIPCPLTEKRIEAVEQAIPNFSWKLRGGTTSGPSIDDWNDLFQAIVHEKGIRPGMRAKQHWFEGQDRNTVQHKHVWTEQDLLELWNSETDEDDEKYMLYDEAENLEDLLEEGGDSMVVPNNKQNKKTRKKKNKHPDLSMSSMPNMKTGSRKRQVMELEEEILLDY